MKIFFYFFLSIILIQNSILAQDCTFRLKNDQVSLKWTAFKTFQKVGVSGTFKNLTIDRKEKGKSIQDLSTGAKFSIKASSVSTKNKTRDEKIAKFFFSSMKGGPIIEGQIKELKQGVLLLNLKMNEVDREIPMNYQIIGKTQLKATGVIDVFDFNLFKELKAINKACYDLHKKKTWNDVEIELFANFDQKCN